MAVAFAVRERVAATAAEAATTSANSTAPWWQPVLTISRCGQPPILQVSMRAGSSRGMVDAAWTPAPWSTGGTRTPHLDRTDGP